MDDRTAVLTFCHENDAEMLEEAILQGCDLECRDGRGRTGLHLAAIRGGTETLRLMLRAGSDANAVDQHHNTPLHFSGHKDIIQLLIEYGAHVDARYTFIYLDNLNSGPGIVGNGRMPCPWAWLELIPSFHYARQVSHSYVTAV